MGGMASATDPVHTDQGQWWFWDETWADRLGPYATEAQARSELDRYCAVVLGNGEQVPAATTLDPAQSLLAAQRAYRQAYDAHQAAGPDHFAGTLDAWRAAWRTLRDAERAVGLP